MNTSDIDFEDKDYNLYGEWLQLSRASTQQEYDKVLGLIKALKDDSSPYGVHLKAQLIMLRLVLNTYGYDDIDCVICSDYWEFLRDLEV
jgi:hypothetical protein